MQLKLPFDVARSRDARQFLYVGTRLVPIGFVRNFRARRYILRVRRDGSARVTLPRRGSVAEARRFAELNVGWLERQLLRLATAPPPVGWRVGGPPIMFRGERTVIQSAACNGSARVTLGTELIPVKDPCADLRREIETYLWQLAWREFPPRVVECAAAHQLPLRRVSVRNQRSRWGSCSRKGCVSLNWRLIQTPPFVRDYIIWHELAHLAHMNHSRRFWAKVEAFCPDYRRAESWLKANSKLLAPRD